MRRLATAAIAIPVSLLITKFAPAWVLALVVALLAGLMLDEYLNLLEAYGRARPGRWFLIPGGLVGASFYLYPIGVIATLVMTILCLAATCVFSGSLDRALDRVAGGLSGVAYCSVLIGFLLLLPRSAIFVLFGIIWAGDSAAYYGGRAFGRHPLAPKVSPRKTVEGAMCGLIGSVIAGIAVGAWLLKLPWTLLAAVSTATAIAGQIGDLAESALKRSAGVKDSSSILPGHGGILDRLDSLLFAAPVFFWLIMA